MIKTYEEIQKEKLAIAIEQKENNEFFEKQCRLYDTKWVNGFPQSVQDEYWVRRAANKQRASKNHRDFVDYLATVPEYDDDAEDRQWATFNRYHDR